MQSSALPALWLVASQLCERLERSWQARGGVKILYKDPLPLSDFYVAVGSHHAARVSVRSSESALNDVCHQFRIIEKRMLVRFKDSRPAPIHHLDKLMQQSYHTLLKYGSIVEQAQAERMRCAGTLACSTGLLVLLMRLRFSLSSGEISEISNYLSPDVIAHNLTTYEDSLTGWEEITDASLAYMLKRSLARRSTEDGIVGPSTPASTVSTRAASSAPLTKLNFPTTTEKLKRRIAMMCDRLGNLASANE